MPTLYVLPSAISEHEPLNQLSPHLVSVIHKLDTFVVEEEKNARRFLKSIQYPLSLNELTLYKLNEHTKANQIIEYIEPLKNGKSMGLLSDAGCPGVADPGAELIKLAHQMNFRVEPLIGPNSLLLALMASGLNGQSFAFNGYLPRDTKEREKKIQTLERVSKQLNQTQLFIEAPYRNNNLLDDLLKNLNPHTYLCIAADITTPTQYIRSMPVYKWLNHKIDLNKRPTVFLFLA